MRQSNDDLVDMLAAPIIALIGIVFSVLVLSLVGLFGMLLETIGLPRESSLNSILSWVLPIAFYLIIFWLFLS